MVSFGPGRNPGHVQFCARAADADENDKCNEGLLGKRAKRPPSNGALPSVRVVGPSLLTALALKHAHGVIPSRIEHPLNELWLCAALRAPEMAERVFALKLQNIIC